MPFTIDLDCPPGNPRPGDLLPQVLEGTGIVLDPQNTSMRLFGNWEWKIPEDQEELYKQERPVIEKRISELYNKGLIRYGSW